MVNTEETSWEERFHWLILCFALWNSGSYGMVNHAWVAQATMAVGLDQAEGSCQEDFMLYWPPVS